MGTSFMFFVEMVVAEPAKADLRVFPYPVMTTSLITCSSACRVIFISPEAMGSLSLLNPIQLIVRCLAASGSFSVKRPLTSVRVPVVGNSTQDTLAAMTGSLSADEMMTPVTVIVFFCDQPTPAKRKRARRKKSALLMRIVVLV